MTCSSILQAAMTAVDGGARSFPSAYDASVQHYQAPTIAYEKAFFHQASRPSQRTPDYSAGWLIADDRSACKPIFVAHSLLCAIALIQNTLPPGVVHDDAWAQLVSAAVTLSTDAEMAPSAQTDPEMPPSAQPAAATPATPGRRRTLSPPSASSPKRRRQEPTTPEPTLPGGEENQSPAPAPAAAPQEYVVKVSNNNRRAERERNKKQAAAAAKSKCSVGLLEPAESDGADEKIAYHQIQPADNADVAWIIKQPVGEGSDFYQKTESPYLTASTMLAKAREVGSKSTWPNLAAFLQAWREYGTPVPGPGSAVASSQTAMQLRPGGGAYAFQQSYYTSCVYKQRLATVIIEYRWAMAFLGRAYHAEIRERGDDRRHVKTQIIDALRGGSASSDT
ncbi:hypothetical protein DPSP01_014689 [Paraphaeosphaeria sporulosa]